MIPAVDGMPLECNSIYLIPPKKNVVIFQDKLHLIDQDLTRGHLPNFPIDIFFHSLAENLNEHADRIDAKGGSGTIDAGPGPASGAASEASLRAAQRWNPNIMERDNPPDLQVEGWLKTLGVELLCQWDVLVFLYRHQSSLVSAEDIARFLGYPTAEVVATLDSLESSGLVERSRFSQGVRLYQVTVSADPARRDALERLMTLADSHPVRRLLDRRLRGSDRPDQNKNDFPLRGVKGSET